MDITTNNTEMKISFIMPARNEEKHIAETITSIKALNLSYTYEIIVVDHNSSDATAAVAKQLGATVLHKVGGTIGAARNSGAKLSHARLIVFIDADVSLTPEWKTEMDLILNKLVENNSYMTGSHCSAPDQGVWLERYWFNNFSQENKTTHLGTGHLIISRSFFEKVGGFDESLVTGEDYEFCIRCKQHGATLENNAQLKVIHRDFPQNLKQFVQREAWHGAGDTASLSVLLGSKVAIMALIFFGAHLLLALAIIFQWAYISVLAIGCVIGLVIVSSLYKYRKKGLKIVFVNTIIFYFYYLGRSISIIRNRKKLIGL